MIKVGGNSGDEGFPGGGFQSGIAEGKSGCEEPEKSGPRGDGGPLNFLKINKKQNFANCFFRFAADLTAGEAERGYAMMFSRLLSRSIDHPSYSGPHEPALRKEERVIV